MLCVRRLVRQCLRDDDLVGFIDCDLSVVPLYKTIAALLNPALWICEVPLRFRRRLAVVPRRNLVARQLCVPARLGFVVVRAPRRLLLARALEPLPGNAALVAALQKNAEAVFGVAVPVTGTPLYTDVRLYGEAGVPAAIYGAGPRTVLESNAKRADEHLDLADLRRATKVVARTLYDLLAPAA